MKIDKKHSFFRLLAIPAVTLVAATLIAPGVGQASESDSVTELPPLKAAQPPIIGYVQVPGALTTPPPPTRPDPPEGMVANKYLDSGYSNLTLLSDSSVKVFSQTVGTSASSQNGLTVHLQRWTGSSWVSVSYRSAMSGGSETSLGYSTTVTKGYYYRVKSDHWSTGDSSREDFSTYSNTLVILKK